MTFAEKKTLDEKFAGGKKWTLSFHENRLITLKVFSLSMIRNVNEINNFYRFTLELKLPLIVFTFWIQNQFSILQIAPSSTHPFLLVFFFFTPSLPRHRRIRVPPKIHNEGVVIRRRKKNWENRDEGLNKGILSDDGEIVSSSFIGDNLVSSDEKTPLFVYPLYPLGVILRFVCPATLIF